MSKLRIRINNKDILKTLPNGFCPGIAHRRVRFGIADDIELMELYPDGTTDEFIKYTRLYVRDRPMLYNWNASRNDPSTRRK